MALYAILFLWRSRISWQSHGCTAKTTTAGYLVLPRVTREFPFVTLETLLPLLAVVAISIVQFPARTLPFFTAPRTVGSGFCTLD